MKTRLCYETHKNCNGSVCDLNLKKLSDVRQAYNQGINDERKRCAAICADQYKQGGNSNGPVWKCHDLIIEGSKIKKPIGNCKSLLRRPFREDPTGVVYE